MWDKLLKQPVKICAIGNATAIIAASLRYIYNVCTLDRGLGYSRIAMPKTRINLRPMATALIVGVILPISIAFFVDWTLGTTPVATIVAIVLFMPLGAIWLSRVSLNELDRVIDEVAPQAPDSVESPPDEMSDSNADQP